MLSQESAAIRSGFVRAQHWAAHRRFDDRVPLRQIERMVVTCQECCHNDSCEFAFDPYNTDGDCLAEK